MCIRDRIYFFYTAGSRNRFEGMDSVCWHTKKTENHIKRIFFSYGKMFWERQTGWKTRAGSAGIDNEAHWSCKRWVTAKFAQNDPIWSQMTKIRSKNQENQGFNFLDSGNPKFSRWRPMQACSPVSFKQPQVTLQYLSALAAKYSKKYKKQWF